MAYVFGNVSVNNESNNNNEGNFGGGNYILKDELKSDWYIYRASDKSIVRPYPVYDDAGIPCHTIGNLEPENPYSIFSEAFAIVPLVVFAGLDGKLQFIDFCTDIDQYAPVGSTLTKTPYSFLVTGLREMLPEQDSNTTKSGLPTPPRLAQAAKNVHYAATSLMFRGAMIRAKGKPSTSKHAVDGIMFKSVYYVSVKSALNALLAEMQKPRDPRMPWGPQNSAADGLFELDGLTIQFDKTGPAAADPYRASFGYHQPFAQAAAKFFQLPSAGDSNAYHAALRNMFGPFQKISDIFRLLTVGEMVSIIKERYPISWVYYGLKDSPYANLLTPDDRDAALRDPEMAPWFGIGTAQPAPAPQHRAAPAQPQAPYQGYGFPQATAAGAPMGPAAPAVPVPPPAPAQTQQGTLSSKLNYWAAKYGQPAKDDQIPF